MSQRTAESGIATIGKNQGEGITTYSQGEKPVEKKTNQDIILSQKTKWFDVKVISEKTGKKI